MPLLQIKTNQQPNKQARTQLLKEASSVVAEALGKPERYVMVTLAAGVDMYFAGSNERAAYLELKSIGLPQSRTGELSAALCRLMENQLQIPADRVYIEFADASGPMWGWNGATF